MAQSPIDGYDTPKVPRSLVHIALCTAQIIFGFSAVVGTIGLPSFHPLTFALVRESTASILLLTVAHFMSIKAGRVGGLFSGSLKDLPTLLLCGFGIFASQAFYIIGIKLSSAVAASVWQPSQPILTAAVCMLMGWEPVNCNRILGIMVAFFGCAIMVIGGGGGGGEAIGGDGSDNGSFSQTCGQFSFLLNCIGISLYVLASKRVIQTGRYECLAVTAWSYVIASIMMAMFAVVMSWSRNLSVFLCSDCDPDNIWHVPPSALPAIAFFVLMTSSVCYGLMTWANKYATGTLVIGYTVVQPVASAVMIESLIIFGVYEGCTNHGNSTERMRALQSVKPCLDEPDIFTVIGALGVFTGLMVLILTEPKDNDESDEGTESESVFEMLELTNYNELEEFQDDDIDSLEGQS